MTHPNALPEPDRVAQGPRDSTVVEVASVWINQGEPDIMVRPAFQDPQVMGRLLAELCWNFAHAYAQVGSHSQREALDALKRGWAEGHAAGDANAQQGGAE